jgi:hypothetical protein
MAKKMTYDEAKEQLVNLRGDLKDARTALRDFLKENKLKRGVDHSNHETKKIAQKFKSLNKKITDFEAKKTELQTFIKENKPKAVRESKYNYPPEIESALDKKKFRARMRAQAKRAGVDVDTYLGDPEKYDKEIAAKKPAKKEKKASTKKAATPKVGKKKVVKKTNKDD